MFLTGTSAPQYFLSCEGGSWQGLTSLYHPSSSHKATFTLEEYGRFSPRVPGGYGPTSRQAAQGHSSLTLHIEEC